MAATRPLRLNVAANAVTAASVLLTALVAVPVILHDVGITGYGVWTLAQTLLLWTTTAEAGIGPAVQRFVAVGHGARAGDDVRRLLWSSCLAYAVAGAVLGGVAVLAARPLTGVFGVPPRLADDAVAMFRIVAAAIVVALLAAALGNVQQGLERFAALAASAAAGSLVYLAAVIACLAAGLGLRGLALAAVLQQAAMLAARLVDLRALLRGPVRLLARRQAAELGSFSVRLQATTLSTLVNSQTDKVVVGLLSSAAVVGQLGIATQVAEAGRMVAGAALSPIISRLSLTHGSGDTAAFHALFARLHRLWTLLVIGGTVMGAALLYPLIAGWLGGGHGRAVGFGAALVLAYGLSLLTGTPVAYLRALGRPSLEARLGLVLVGCNVVLTAALGVAFGAGGVVAATALAHALGTAWFLRAFRRAVGPEVGRLPAALLGRAVLVAALAGAAALAWGVAMVALLPAGLALAGVAAGAAVAAVAYLPLATGVPPTPAGLRRLVLTGA